MSDQQPDDEPRTSLSDLLNRQVPANPGKPRPWVPADAPSYSAQDSAQDEVSAAGVGEDVEDSAERGAGEASASEPPPASATAAEADATAPPGEPQGPGDLSAFLADVGRVTSALQDRLTGLQATIESAREQTYEGASADESVTVTVSGRPRVTNVYVGPKAVRGGPEALGAWVVEAVTAAMGKARAGAQTALLDGLDPELRAAIAAEIAKTTENTTSGDNSAAAGRPWGGRHA